jgi:hypothetical protein
MTTNNHSLNHERPPANQSRRSVIGENLLTVVTIVGVIGEVEGAQNRIESSFSDFQYQVAPFLD